MFLSYPLKLAHKASVTPRYPQLAYNLDMKAGKQLASVLALSGPTSNVHTSLPVTFC